MRELSGRQVVVVGGLGGLGRAVCDAFVEAGALVRALDAVAPPEPSRSIDSEIVDVTSDAQLRHCFDEAVPPWAVVNVVGGFAPARDLTEFDVDEFDEQVRLNLTTAALVTKHALRRMGETGEGRLVHTASRAAVEIEGAGFAYSVSKLGVLHLVRTAALQTRGTAITVNAVVPSIIDTPANRRAMPNSAHERWPAPEDIAAVYRFLASPAAKLISGAEVPVYGLA